MNGAGGRATSGGCRIGTLALALWGGGIEESLATTIDSCRGEKDCLCGRNFSLGPCRAVSEKLLLPDRHSALERIDAEPAGVERGGAMGRGDCDEHGSLTDLEPPEAVNHGETLDREFFAHLPADFSH